MFLLATLAVFSFPSVFLLPLPRHLLPSGEVPLPFLLSRGPFPLWWAHHCSKPSGWSVELSVASLADSHFAGHLDPQWVSVGCPGCPPPEFLWWHWEHHGLLVMWGGVTFLKPSSSHPPRRSAWSSVTHFFPSKWGKWNQPWLRMSPRLTNPWLCLFTYVGEVKQNSPGIS